MGDPEVLAGGRPDGRLPAAAQSRGAPGLGLWSAAGALAWAVILLGIGVAAALLAR